MLTQTFVTKLAEMISDRNNKLFTSAELLFIVNMGRRELASTLMLFSEYESISIKQNIEDYSLEHEPLIIISATDSKGYDRPINIGYSDSGVSNSNMPFVENTTEGSLILKIAPNIFRVEQPAFNNEDDDLYIDFNYYYVPDDLELTDTMDMSGALRDILFLYCRKEISSRPTVGSNEIDLSARNYFTKLYEAKVAQYQSMNPTNYYKSISNNKISSGGYV